MATIELCEPRISSGGPLKTLSVSNYLLVSLGTKVEKEETAQDTSFSHDVTARTRRPRRETESNSPFLGYTYAAEEKLKLDSTG